MKRHITRLHCVPKYLFGGIQNTTGYNACYGPVVDKNAQREAEDIKYINRWIAVCISSWAKKNILTINIARAIYVLIN